MQRLIEGVLGLQCPETAKPWKQAPAALQAKSSTCTSWAFPSLIGRSSPSNGSNPAAHLLREDSGRWPSAAPPPPQTGAPPSHLLAGRWARPRHPCPSPPASCHSLRFRPNFPVKPCARPHSETPYSNIAKGTSAAINLSDLGAEQSDTKLPSAGCETGLSTKLGGKLYWPQQDAAKLDVLCGSHVQKHCTGTSPEKDQGGGTRSSTCPS